MRIIEDTKLDFADVLFVPKRSRLGSRSEVDLVREIKFPHAKTVYSGVPIVAANMDTVATFEMAKALLKYRVSTALHKHYGAEELAGFFKGLSEEDRMRVFLSTGITAQDHTKLKRVVAEAEGAVRMICIDVANGYSEPFLRFVEKIRREYPELVIMAGNVVTPEMTEALILGGVDIVKVGIGPGSVCTTRKMTGVGYPQLSAIIECSDAAHGLNGQICGDGGCTVPGDVSKAFGGGADFVMIGGMFAGHDECGGEIVTKGEERFVKFYGMSSAEAMKKHAGGVAEYRASEGKVVLLPYRGPVETTVKEILGGMRSTCTYVGAKRLKDLPKCTTFIKVGRQINEVFGKS